jgi:uncharacterized membrane protein YeaQ/YmgE (transglycosylase-associated protein family)
MSIITFLLVGLIAGFLAGMFIKGKGFGVLGNLIIGVVGAFVGAFLLRLIGFESHSPISDIITAFIGSVTFLFLLGKLAK